MAVLLVLAAGAPRATHAQDAGGGWDAARALRLAERMHRRRGLPHADSGLTSYRSHASGYVYFYFDGPGTEQPTLAKISQVALDVYWAAPDFTKQRIVGLRDEDRLPNRIYYHLDHLTVVQDEFEDVIRMGDGDEVRAVPHPAAPGARAVYQYRLADSLTLRLPGAAAPVRVYELEVRPRRLDQPAVVGSVFVDRATAAIVRMAFTFTAASYVDPRLDYIHVSLDNGLWQGRYWLPHEQRVEIRRQIPQFDFPVGAVIRGVYRIGDYRFNLPIPTRFFRGSTVVAAPARAREAYPFTAGLFDGLAEEGLTPLPDLERLRREAVELVGRRVLNGLPDLRWYIPGISSVLRFNRAEGLFLGAGASYSPDPDAGLDVTAGYATGPDRPSLGATLQLGLGERTSVRAEVYHNALRDLGIRAGAAGLLNTITAAAAGKDYLDPFLASGGGLTLERELGDRWNAATTLLYEEHRSARLTHRAAPLNGSAAFRPVRPIDDGVLIGARVSLRHTASAAALFGWHGDLELDAGTLEGEGYGRATVGLDATRRTGDGSTRIDLHAAAGVGAGELPRQQLFVLGGRATLPGYAYRSFAGDVFALMGIEASHEVLAPWLRLRGIAGLGWTDFTVAAPPPGWRVEPTEGVRASLGLGVGAFYGLFRLDAVRGLDDGDWQVLFSINPRLWDVL